MTCRNNYPFDLTAGLDYTRLPTVASKHPYPQMCGSIAGVMPLMDVYAMSPVSSGAWGAGIGTPQAANMSPFYGTIEYPTLQKVRG